MVGLSYERISSWCVYYNNIHELQISIRRTVGNKKGAWLTSAPFLSFLMDIGLIALNLINEIAIVTENLI